MALDIENMFIIAFKECDCRNEAPQLNPDGYFIGRSQNRCMDCLGKGIIQTKIKLTDLKNILGS